MARTTEWLNANKYRRYPFKEDASFAVSTIALTDAMLLDFKLISYLAPATELYLKTVEVYTPPSGPKAAVFTISYASGMGLYDDLSFTVPETAAFPFVATVQVSNVHHAVGSFGDGVLELFSFPDGTYVVSGQPEIEPALLMFQDKHRVLTVKAFGEAQTTLTGDIYLEEGYNCQILIEPEYNTVNIAAIRGAGAGISCDKLTTDKVLCEDVLARINGMVAGAKGDFRFAGANGVSVTPDAANHQLIIKVEPSRDDLKCG